MTYLYQGGELVNSKSPPVGALVMILQAKGRLGGLED